MTEKKRILVADDEPSVREIICRYLLKEGYEVLEAENGPQTLQLLYEQQPDLLILDIMLPGLDGFTITRSLRDPVDENNENRSIPIIILTARTEEEDRITGFQLGADDYVGKPFSPRELMLRVKAVLRRGKTKSGSSETTTQEAVIKFADVVIDPNARTVTRQGDHIVLTAKEFELLWFLARNPRQVFSRNQLLNQIWGYEFYGDDSTITVHIHRLREKLEPDPNQPRFIHTVWGVGYKFEDGT